VSDRCDNQWLQTAHYGFLSINELGRPPERQLKGANMSKSAGDDQLIIAALRFVAAERLRTSAFGTIPQKAKALGARTRARKYLADAPMAGPLAETARAVALAFDEDTVPPTRELTRFAHGLAASVAPISNGRVVQSDPLHQNVGAALQELEYMVVAAREARRTAQRHQLRRRASGN
jgi:hypothetical protein